MTAIGSRCRPGFNRRSPGAPVTLKWLLSNTRKRGACLEWIGTRRKYGYGQVSYKGRPASACRVVMELVGHDINGLVVRHKCDNPPCINPKHLEPGTQLDNIADTKIRGGVPKGERHHNCKISDANVRRMRRIAHRHTHAQLASLFGLSRSHVGLILNGGSRA